MLAMLVSEAMQGETLALDFLRENLPVLTLMVLARELSEKPGGAS